MFTGWHNFGNRYTVTTFPIRRMEWVGSTPIAWFEQGQRIDIYNDRDHAGFVVRLNTNAKQGKTPPSDLAASIGRGLGWELVLMGCERLQRSQPFGGYFRVWNYLAKARLDHKLDTTVTEAKDG